MKNLAMAGAVAAVLSLTALSQRAAAQDCNRRGFDVSASIGVSLGAHWTPMFRNRDRDCGQCGGYPGCESCGHPGFGANNGYSTPPGAYGYPPYGYAAAPFAAPQPAPGPAAPALPTLPLPKTEPTGVQNAGYTYPAAYGYDYGSWYGYPYYQDYGYWYGYGR